MRNAAISRRTIVVPDRLAAQLKRLEAARAGHHGVQVMSIAQLAARLAGGFTEPADGEAISAAVRIALAGVDLGDLEAIRSMPGTPAAVNATLHKSWDAGLDLAGRAGDHPRIAVLQRLDAAVRSALPAGALVAPALVDAALPRVGFARAVFGAIDCERISDLAPCWRPLLLALAQVVPVRWKAGARAVPDWLSGSAIEVQRASAERPALQVVSASDAAHEALEAMRWARALLASGQAKPEEIAFASASTAPFDEHFQALRTEAGLDLHFVHGVPAATTPAGQQAAALADVLVHGLTMPRLRRLARVCANAALFQDLPDGWLRVLPTQFAPRSAAAWERALQSIPASAWPDGADHGVELRRVVTALLADAGLADELGSQVLKGQALSLWRRALGAGPVPALMSTLASLCVDDQGDPCASMCWMPADALAASPRPFVRLLGLNAGLWPRRGSEDRLLPDHIVPARELDPVPLPASDRTDFDAILADGARQAVLSFSRRDSRGRHIARSALLRRFAEPVVMARHAIPSHALSEGDRLLAQPSEFRDGEQAAAASACWSGWHCEQVTAHDGLIAADHPALRFLTGRVQSASSLRKLLRYPLAYLWQYGLGWRVPDEGSDALVLDARQFGLLVHRVLELALDAGAHPERDPGQRMQEVMASVRAEWEATQPVPPAQIWRRTLAQAQTLAEAALTVLPPGGSVDMRSFAEVPFGGAERKGEGPLPWTNEAPIPIPGTGMRMQGYIDRLDVSGDRLRACVVDYKTGGELNDGAVLGGGTELQRSLYALAVRALLGERTEVAASLFYLHSQAQPVLEDPDQASAVLSGYLSLARASFEAGHALPGPDSGGPYDDFRLLLPALAHAVYCKRKHEAVVQRLGDAATVWEAE